jgi:hypothetical protein
MKQRTGALVAFGVAAALILGVAGNADASLTSAPYGTQTIPGPQPRPSPRAQPVVVAKQPPRPTPSPAPGVQPHPQDAREAWARNSVEVAGI